MSIARKIILIVVIILVAGASGIAADRFIFPHLLSLDLFSKNRFLRSLSDDVTVINKTEQVYVKEESSLSKVANQSASSVVDIAYFPDPNIKTNQTSKSQTQAVFPKNRTGMIVTSDGLILTYIAESNPENFKYTVLAGDGNTYEASFAGVDSYSNLAFLKINAANLPVVSFGNSDDIKPGEKVVAIGNSLGSYGNSYASGVLSDFNPSFSLAGKPLASSDKMEGVFETDINEPEPFVGGPIIDYSSQVIGITGEIQSDGKSIFFQIPSNKIRNVIDKEIRKEISNNASLGIYYIPLTKTYALANGLKVENGAMIYSSLGQQGLAIITGSPADKAGLKIGDIITEVSGEKIAEGSSLPDILYKHKKGDQIELTILRGGQETKVGVSL